MARWLTAAILLFVGACESGSDPVVSYAGGDFEIVVRSQELRRTAVVHVPEDLDPSQGAPLLVVLHGTGGTGLGMQLVTGLDEYADGAGMVVAYPNSISGLWTIGPTEKLDMDFLTDLVEAIDQDIRVDRGKIFFTGFSRGALLAMKMACERSEWVAGVAPVGAPVRTEIVGGCPSYRPIPALFILGTEDQFYPWEGYTNGDEVVFGGVESGRWWAEMNGCDPAPIITQLPDLEDDGTTVARWAYPGCPADAPLEFFAIEGGDHTWPGSPFDQGFLGRVSLDIVGSSVIVNFFADLL